MVLNMPGDTCFGGSGAISAGMVHCREECAWNE